MSILSSLSSVASLAQMQANDVQNAQTIYTEMQAQAQKSEMGRWKILSALKKFAE